MCNFEDIWKRKIVFYLYVISKKYYFAPDSALPSVPYSAPHKMCTSTFFENY